MRVPETMNRDDRYFRLLAMPSKQAVYCGVVHSPMHKDWDVLRKPFNQLGKLNNQLPVDSHLPNR